MKLVKLLLAGAFGLFAAAQAALAETDGARWRELLAHQLPLLGHRNWIVVADSAYPLQTAPGIETVETGAEQLETVKAVLDALSKSVHVRPIIYTDAELPYVPEAEAKGIELYRSVLGQTLIQHQPISLPHEQIINLLDQAGSKFHVLVLKTRLALPYTTVFFQLECAYWSAEAEARLRAAMKAAQ